MSHEISGMYDTIHGYITLHEFFLQVDIGKARLPISVDLNVLILLHVVVEDHVNGCVLSQCTTEAMTSEDHFQWLFCCHQLNEVLCKSFPKVRDVVIIEVFHDFSAFYFVDFVVDECTVYQLGDQLLVCLCTRERHDCLVLLLVIENCVSNTVIPLVAPVHVQGLVVAAQVVADGTTLETLNEINIAIGEGGSVDVLPGLLLIVRMLLEMSQACRS